MPMRINPNTEIRKARHVIKGVIDMLELNKNWERLMSEIRPEGCGLEDKKRKYNVEDILKIRYAKDDRLRTEIFLDEWGTSGRERPTIQLLYDYLKKLGLNRAADHIGVNFLNLAPIEQEPCKLLSETDKTESGCFMPSVNGEGTEPQSINLEILFKVNREIGKKVERVCFEELKASTQNFDSSCRVSEGAFGSVYVGKLNNVNCAIKVLKTHAIEHFERELIVLSVNENQHPSLMRLIAVSVDEIPCLIYPFMAHGSLKDRLALKLEELSPLQWQMRMIIASNVIEGLRYLHNRPHPIVHRDIKPSNILLDKADLAKIGDFGSIREKKDALISMVETVQGTPAYMPFEAHLHYSSTKLDVYSYGMVLLELLTGLPIVDEERGHLKDRVKREFEDANNNLTNLLDVTAGMWPQEIANELYCLANNCSEGSIEKWYNSNDVAEHMENLINLSRIVAV